MTTARYTNTQINNCPHDLIYTCSKEYFNKCEDTNSNYFELPYPIHDAFTSDRADTVLALIKEKEKYSEIKKNAKPHIRSTKQALTKCKSGSTSLALGILNYYRTSDPDVYFSCDYNFYYTGGCIDLVTSEGTRYFIRPNSGNELWAFNSRTNNNFYMNFKTESPIMNLRVTCTNKSIFLIIREKNKISIISTNDILCKKYKVVWKKMSLNIPFIDAKINPNGNLVAIVDADFTLNIFNISENKTLKTFPRELCHNDVDCFSQIEFYADSLIFANRNSIKLFSIHSDKVTELNLDLEACNNVCCFSVFEDSIYIATRHDLLKYDLTDPSQSCQYSSHFLSFAPCYMDITDCDEDTFIILSAQNIDQKVIFGMKSLNRLPARLPSLMDTLKEVKLRGHLVLKDDLEGHLNQSVTGIKLIRSENELILISSNCTGQLFQQRINIAPFDTLGPMDRLYNWLNKLSESGEPFQPTAIVDMTKLFEQITNKNHKLESQQSRDFGKRDEFLKKFSAEYRKENYCTLMTELMSIWEVDDAHVEEKLSDDAQSESKVASWIESQMFEYHSDDLD